MEYISRAEEMVMLAILKLGDNAYGVTIEKVLRDLSGKPWAFGALFVTLDRLSKKGLVDSSISDPTSERGGRRKRMYRLSQEGLEALKSVRELQKTVWSKSPDPFKAAL